MVFRSWQVWSTLLGVFSGHFDTIFGRGWKNWLLPVFGEIWKIHFSIEDVYRRQVVRTMGFYKNLPIWVLIFIVFPLQLWRVHHVTSYHCCFSISSDHFRRISVCKNIHFFNLFCAEIFLIIHLLMIILLIKQTVFDLHDFRENNHEKRSIWSQRRAAIRQYSSSWELL